jgi:hypothetical protein
MVSLYETCLQNQYHMRFYVCINVSGLTIYTPNIHTPSLRTDLDASGYGAAIGRLVTFVQIANKSLDNYLPDIQSKLVLLHILINIID